MRACVSLIKIGHKHGHLEVVEMLGLRPVHGRNRLSCHCRCKCGKEIIVSIDEVYDKSKRLSCGCIKAQCGPSNCRWKGHGEISASVWNQIKRNPTKHKSKNITFDISIEQAWDLFLKQDRKCTLTGIELTFAVHVPVTKRNRAKTASLDRIDSNGPYSVENCQWVHKIINNMKTNLDQHVFIKYCKLVAKHNKRKNDGSKQ